jgi:hypothetical protein
MAVEDYQELRARYLADSSVAAAGR